ncbi:hypothetical protein LP420_01315 [Massilia sp. B-10]|nr:hypothetical protein LP420_01315 [Massilia sp. B-10]
MLQDLDARGSQSGASLQAEIKPVLAAEPRLPLRRIAIGATVLVLAMALGAWWWFKKPLAAGPRPLTMGAPAAPALPLLRTAVVTAPVVLMPAPKEVAASATTSATCAAATVSATALAAYLLATAVSLPRRLPATVPSPETAAAPRRAVKPRACSAITGTAGKARPPLGCPHRQLPWQAGAI